MLLLTNKLKKSRFFIRTSSLLFYTIMAQVLSLGMVAILARVFDQYEIGIYYVFMSHLAIVGSIVLLSYHVKLPSIAFDEACKLVSGMVIIIFVMASLTVLVLLITGYSFSIACGIAVIAAGLHQLANVINQRECNIRMLGVTRVANSILNLVVILFLWKSNLKDANVLIWTYTLSNFLFSVIYAYNTMRSYIFPMLPAREIYRSCFEHRKNPVLLAPSELFNSMAYNLPTIIIAKYFGSEWASQYAMVMKFCDAPVSMLGGTVSQAFYSEMGKAVRDKEKSAFDKFRKFAKYQFGLSITIGGGICTVFPLLIIIALGERWENAALASQILSPMYTLMLFHTPLTILLYIYDQQEFCFSIQVLFLLISIISFGYGVYNNDIWGALWMFSILSSLRYFLIITKVMKLSLRLKEL